MQKLAQWCYEKNRLVIGLWVAAIIGIGTLAGISGGGFVDNFSLPGSESQRAYDLLKDRFPQQSGDSVQVVFKTSSGVLTDPAKQAQTQALVEKLSTLPEVAAVQPPTEGGSISQDGRIGFATVLFDKQAIDLKKADVERVIDTAKAAETDDMQVNLGGQAIKFAQQPEQSATELVGVAVAIIVLVVVLGSFAAMTIPLIVTFTSLGVAMTIVLLLSSAFNIATFGPTLAVMIALGVGIDYSLLILNRFRDERRHGVEVREATLTALDTAGRSVLFAGATVVIALLGMLLLGISFLNGPAVASAIAVFFTMVGSLTLLPALLGTFGGRLKVGTPVTDDASHFWGRWAVFVERHPRPIALATVVVVAVIALPVFGMNLGSSDSGSDAPGSTTRLAYDHLSEGFGPGFNGPFLIVAELPPGAGDEALVALSKAISVDENVAAVTPPTLNESKDTATLTVFPKSKPQETETADLLDRLRSDVIPPVEKTSGITASVGGAIATTTDLNQLLADKLPLFIAVVVGLSLLLLMVVFRSFVIPIKAAFMNVLSIGAALGVITFVFQDGHLASLIGVDSTGPIEAFLPVFMFAIVFGLSMDYEVFLVSRMHEEWEHSRDAHLAVRRGLALTGKVVFAAAVIMVSVFASFMLGDDRTIKLFGLGLASAVFVDAFIIRLILVPALMFIFGKASWWMPAAIERRMPRLSIEGPPELAGAQEKA
jgi:RND superfamily putative drug exporter